LQRFQMIVLQDAALQDELRGCPDRATFVACVVECARARDCVIEPGEIEAALDAAARAWLLSWMQR
jgi:hypothetical protein